MTIRPMKGICPVCRRISSYNPSVGKIYCPSCMKKGRRVMLIQGTSLLKSPIIMEDPEKEYPDWRDEQRGNESEVN